MPTARTRGDTTRGWPRSCRWGTRSTRATRSTAATCSAARTAPGAATQAEADRANDDTCHWPNIAPQHEVFNQSGQDPELSLWGLLENQVAAEADRLGRKINVFNGPVFLDDDPPYRGHPAFRGASGR